MARAAPGGEEIELVNAAAVESRDTIADERSADRLAEVQKRARMEAAVIAASRARHPRA